jgi:probable F420-dependent oxidoreductase
MRIDGILSARLTDVPRVAQEMERLGYDGLLTAEAKHDPFLPLVLAAEHTEHVELATSIVVALGRTPITVAVMAQDLQGASKGRFTLGLGSQVRAHIERRYSMPWSHPAARMREFVLALRAIWRCFDGESVLDFRGEFYQHTLMPPFFNPGPSGYPPPPIRMAAVGERMAETAGGVADGVVLHGLTTERYVREVTVPAVERGLAASGRTRASLEICLPGLIVTGNDEAEMERMREAVRKQIAFYGSTPAYRPVLRVHGWESLQDELTAMSKQGRWSEMPSLVDDRMLETFAVVADAEHIAGRISDRYGDVVDRFSFHAPYAGNPERWSAVLAQLRDSTSAASAWVSDRSD